MKYLAIFLSITIPKPSGQTLQSKNGSKNRKAVQVEPKTFPGFQDTVSLMFLSKNLLFRKLCHQITIDFVWKFKAFTLNVVKILYLIF